MPNDNWLPHLTNEMMIGARNNNLCSYVIALEGWRRGLTLTFYSRKVKKEKLHVPGCLFSLSDGEVTHMFYKSRGMRVKSEAFTIGDNKILAKKALDKKGVPVPKGEMFTKDATDDEVIDYASKIGYPVVLKPSNAAQGKGVIANIDNESFLKESLQHVRNELNYKEVILEEHVSGEEYRVYVMNDTVVAVLNRVPANITGNGKNTIKELISIKNKERRKNPRLFSCLIKVDYEVKNMLEKQSLSVDSVPASEEVIYLREKSNISSGGDSIDLTDEFPEEFKQVAIKALKQIPNFPNGGVDIMVDSSKPLEEAAKVIELTPVPQIGSLVFPMKGKGRDVPSAIIDFYFPETKHLTNANPNIYFSLKDILAPLLSKTASEITVIPCPNDIDTQRKYIVTGKVQGVGFRRWIRKKALEADLYGYVQNLQNGSLVIAVAGKEESVTAFKTICETGPKRANIDNVIEKKWENPLKVGFEIKANPRRKKQKQAKVTPSSKRINKKMSLLSRIKRKIKQVLK